jgi:hypothetical protein
MNSHVYSDPGTGTSVPPVRLSEPTHDQVAALAQHIYEEEGCPRSRANAHWLEAERYLRHYAEVDAIAPPAQFEDTSAHAHHGAADVPSPAPDENRTGLA